MIFFQISGTLIKPIEIPISEAHCTRENKRRTLSIPILFLSWQEAKRTCDKFHLESMAGPFAVKKNNFL